MQKKIPNVILSCVLLITGCGILNPKPTPTPDLMDKSTFTGIPCAAPCWYGLEVGKSNESDLRTTIPTLTFIDQNSVAYHSVLSMPSLDPNIWGEGILVIANCILPRRECLTLKIADDTLTKIVLEPNYPINVEEAIKYLGNPEYIGFDRAGGERIACRVFLIWNEKKLVLASKIFEGIKAAEKNCFTIEDTGKISANLLVSEVKYLSAAAIDGLRTSDASWFYEFSGTSPK